MKLIGTDVLPVTQKPTLQTARVIRVCLLTQNAYHKDDTFMLLTKQLAMMNIILYLNDKARQLVEAGVQVRELEDAGLFDKLIKIKYEIPNDRPGMFAGYYTDIDETCKRLLDSRKSAVTA